MGRLPRHLPVYHEADKKFVYVSHTVLGKEKKNVFFVKINPQLVLSDSGSKQCMFIEVYNVDVYLPLMTVTLTRIDGGKT